LESFRPEEEGATPTSTTSILQMQAAARMKVEAPSMFEEAMTKWLDCSFSSVCGLETGTAEG
jgi:hypothetical protein